MKERSILFSGPMVRAILDGRKTQTRRVVKPQPSFDGAPAWGCLGGRGFGFFFGDEFVKCPHGEPGDRLWAKEAWAIRDCGSRVSLKSEAWPSGWPIDRLQYVATDEPPRPDYWWNKRSPLFMPRWASRITLEVTGVRVERVQGISEEDALAEGIVKWVPSEEDARIVGAAPAYRPPGQSDFIGGWSAVSAFERLWDSINGRRPGCSWADNPWVWVVEFERIDAKQEAA